MTSAIALDHSIGIVQPEPDLIKSARPIRQILRRYLRREIHLSRVTQMGEGLSRRDEGDAEGLLTRVHPGSRTRLCLLAAPRFGCSLQLFSSSSGRTIIHRDGDVFAELKRSFCENIVRDSESRRTHLPVQRKRRDALQVIKAR